jgi:DivIVA domain-containing protein
MALTPEDVVNKRFQPTKFREGYDQDEVDDFLDEVVVELRRLNQENEELRQRLIASDSRISDLQRSGGQSSHALEGADEADEAAISAPAPVAAIMASVPAPAPAVVAPVVDEEEDEAVTTTNLLQLARRLHEEHVREGIEKRDKLIAEGHATAARLLAEADAQHRAQVSSFEEERSQLEQRIDELRIFEREYRQKLKSYIEGQLHDLESPQGALAGADSSTPPSNFSGFAGN